MPAVSRPGLNGKLSGITSTPVELINPGYNYVLTQGLQVLADSNNTDIVYIGFSSGITPGNADATDGFPLAAGASLFLPCRRPEEIWVKAASGTLKVWFIGQ